LLLCADERLQPDNSKSVDLGKLADATLVKIGDASSEKLGRYRPWIVVDVPAVGGRTLRLIDFANAGSTGKWYWSWLPGCNLKPPCAAVFSPVDHAVLDGAPIVFAWRKPSDSLQDAARYSVEISDSPGFERVAVRYGEGRGDSLVLPLDEVKKLQPKRLYYWRILAKNKNGESQSTGPYKRFVIDPDKR
jgi:hypothetical protein